MQQFNPTLTQIAEQAINEARQEDLDDEDARLMAIGAVVRYGRDQGIIGEDLSTEMEALIELLVKSRTSKS